MIDGFLDTAVLVNMLRQHEPALRWAEANTSLNFAITPLVWMELVFGATNKAHLQHVTHFMSLFDMVMLAEDDLVWAMMQLERFRLSHNVGILDCLIAAPAARLGLPLYTHNLKHFTPLLGELARKPYD